MKKIYKLIPLLSLFVLFLTIHPNQTQDPSFTEVTSVDLTGVYLGSVAWGDYNGNGRLDILLTGEDSSDNWIAKIFENTGTFDPVSLSQPEISSKPGR